MKFASPELQKSFDTAKPILEKITETKNRISSEIKNLEKFFQSLDMNESLSYLATNPNLVSNMVFDQFCEYSSSGVGTATEEFLIWDNIAKRIMYVRNEYEACADMEDFNQVSLLKETCKNIVNRPLIETTFDVRKKIYEHHLSDFLSYAAQKYEVHEKQIENDSFDIPF